MRIEEGEIYKHRASGQFVHVKEVTQYYGGGKATVVCSDDCTFGSDSKTSCGRQAIAAGRFKELYTNQTESLSSKRQINDSGGPLANYDKEYYYSEAVVRGFIKDLKRKLSINEEGYEIIDELAGDKLI